MENNTLWMLGFWRIIQLFRNIYETPSNCMAIAFSCICMALPCSMHSLQRSQFMFHSHMTWLSSISTFQENFQARTLFSVFEKCFLLRCSRSSLFQVLRNFNSNNCRAFSLIFLSYKNPL